MQPDTWYLHVSTPDAPQRGQVEFAFCLPTFMQPLEKHSHLAMGFCKPVHPTRKQHEFTHLRPKKRQHKTRGSKGFRGPPPSSSCAVPAMSSRLRNAFSMSAIKAACQPETSRNNAAQSPPFTTPKGCITNRDIAKPNPHASHFCTG
jgi:hypothetical protein